MKGMMRNVSGAGTELQAWMIKEELLPVVKAVLISSV